MTRIQIKNCKIESDWKERAGMAFAAAVAVALTTGVVAAFVYFVIGLASIISNRQLSAEPVNAEAVAEVSTKAAPPMQKAIQSIALYGSRFEGQEFSVDWNRRETSKRHATLSGNPDSLRIQQ